MGSLYSKMSGGRSGSGNQVAAAAAAGTTTTAIDPIIIRGKQQDDDDASPHLPDTSMNSSCISLGIEVKVNGESDDSHLVTSSSSSHAHPSTTGTGTPAEEEGDEDTDETEAEDVNNASLAVHPSTDDTLNSDPSHVSETNGHSAGGSSSNATPSKAETVATWAQVVAGMSATPAASHLSAEVAGNDTDERESVTSDDSSSVNSSEVNGRGHRASGGPVSANGSSSSSTGARTRQRSSGKRSSTIRTSTPTNSPSKRLRGGDTGSNSSTSGSPVSGAKNVLNDPDRPFACRAPGCEWAFKALFHLNRHRKTVHGFNEPVTAASYQLMQQQWAAQQQQAAPAPGHHQEVLEDGQVVHQQQDMSNFFDHVLLDANSANTY